VERHEGGRFERVDKVRLRTLIESAFGRPLVEGALERDVDRVYIEENYLGAALMAPSPVGPYLTKFAVERTAQGEGIGGDLWSVLARDYPTFFWRARPTNPITPWYARQCDGLVRFPEWHVFWRGLPPARIEAAIDFALGAPPDFLPSPVTPTPVANETGNGAGNGGAGSGSGSNGGSGGGGGSGLPVG
jgi:acetylglutamate kinase